MNDREIVFVCVPTHDEEYNGDKPTSHLEPKDLIIHFAETLSELNEFMTKDQMIVVMSTVLPTHVKKTIDLVPTLILFIVHSLSHKEQWIKISWMQMYLINVQEKLSVDQEAQKKID